MSFAFDDTHRPTSLLDPLHPQRIQDDTESRAVVIPDERFPKRQVVAWRSGIPGGHATTINLATEDTTPLSRQRHPAPPLVVRLTVQQAHQLVGELMHILDYSVDQSLYECRDSYELMINEIPQLVPIEDRIHRDSTTT